MLPPPILKKPNLGYPIRREVACAHKLVLKGDHYECRRCHKVFEMSRPTVVDTEEEFARALGRAYR